MRIVIFTHSLVSDWNHGNAHFLRGMATELIEHGCDVRIYEPAGGWSRRNLVGAYGKDPVWEFEREYPGLRSTLYDLPTLLLEKTLDGADLVLVHEWNDPVLVARIGDHRARKGGYRLLFHDTHHRVATAPSQMTFYNLQHYDGVLAYGNVIRDLYRQRGWARDAWTWHEAADIRKFRPRHGDPSGDLVWIGNWGDGERTGELREFLIQPVKTLGLKACVYGVRYPDSAVEELAAAGIEFKGWLPNYRVPEVFSQFRATIHIPRRPYAETLPGIPTIRPFEALACGIPLICSPWNDCENLFRPRDFLMAKDGDEMAELLNRVVSDPCAGAELAAHGLETIHNRHTCAHRAEELFTILGQINSTTAVGGRA